MVQQKHINFEHKHILICQNAEALKTAHLCQFRQTRYEISFVCYRSILHLIIFSHFGQWRCKKKKIINTELTYIYVLQSFNFKTAHLCWFH